MSTWTDWKYADVRYYTEGPKLLISSNMRKVFMFGHVLCGIEDPTGFIIAGSFEDAWEELCEYAYSIDGPCDHGDDPELAALIAAAKVVTLGQGHETAQDDWDRVYSWIDEHCDCESCESGYVWMVDRYWMRPMVLPVEKLLQALRFEEGMEVW